MNSELSGYLYLQPKGALSRLKRRQVWFVFDDSTCHLFYYKTDQDMEFNHLPIGSINIRKAGLSLHMDQHHQFCISSENRDHIITADSHDSMMHWLNALQLKRDAFADKHSVQCFNEEQYRKHQTKTKTSKLSEGVEEAEEAKSDDNGEKVETTSCHSNSLRVVSTSHHGSISSFTDISSESSFEIESHAANGLDNLSISSTEGNSAPIGSLRELQAELEKTKKELKRLQKREEAYKELLASREEVIIELNDKVEQLGHKNSFGSNSEAGAYCQKLHDQNTFLNNEIQRLTKHKQKDRTKLVNKHRNLQEVEAENKKLKRDYVSLLQSCITLSSIEAPCDLQQKVFGNRHLQRISQLIEECRQTDPKLPDARTLFNTEHIDQYGFIHPPKHQALFIHYVCQLLYQHYSMDILEKAEYHKRWDNFMVNHRKNFHEMPELRELILLGIPDEYRAVIWTQLAINHVQDIKAIKGDNYYKSLLAQIPGNLHIKSYQRQIELDLLRTMPQNIHFKDGNCEKVNQLREVLEAYCIHNPDIGYCQGLNFSVGTCLLYMEAEQAFWCLVAFVDRYFSSGYFDRFLVGAQADQAVLQELIAQKLPVLYEHFKQLDIEISTITLTWFLAIFFDSVPFEVSGGYEIDAKLSFELMD
uniref:TBC1 domain family member 2B-like n=1 Tax=Saccoglossus kowalevskii TaxID=10224 RepID=A0ABM0MCI8_SACKO|nr:PREDICTED: TBC1 domain family member 2B-like [Saccoglossus kowalevskii]